MSFIASILQGDSSLVRPLHAPSTSSGSTAATAHHEWSSQHNMTATFSSLDLSGNRISDVGLELIADCLQHSALRFIALKFNACREMPLPTSHSAWTIMRRAASPVLEPRIGLALASPPRVPDCPAAHSSANAGADCARHKLFQRHYNMRFTAGVTRVSSSSSSLPHKTSPQRRSAKRFKCNVVHPE